MFFKNLVLFWTFLNNKAFKLLFYTTQLFCFVYLLLFLCHQTTLLFVYNFHNYNNPKLVKMLLTFIYSSWQMLPKILFFFYFSLTIFTKNNKNRFFQNLRVHLFSII